MRNHRGMDMARRHRAARCLRPQRAQAMRALSTATQATLEIEVGESTIYNFAQNFQISKKFHNVKNVKINNMVKIATCISS